MVRRVDGFTPWMTVLNKIDVVLFSKLIPFGWAECKNELNLWRPR
jgi:hypothetical protein